jgi:hypothetical protein
MLLLGWLAAQLGWSTQGVRGNPVRFLAGNEEVVGDLTESAGCDISRVELVSDALTVTASLAPGGSFLQIQLRDANGRMTDHVTPADCPDLTSLLNEELASWGRHRVYLKALTAAERLL